MLFGMGTVFVFLTVLVFATNLMSTLVNKINPQSDTDHSRGQATTSDNQTGGNTNAPNDANGFSPADVNPTIILAIEKAIAAHRANQ